MEKPITLGILAVINPLRVNFTLSAVSRPSKISLVHADGTAPSVPHTDILPLIKYYATAWKTGAYPKITKDQVFVMARPHPAMATATGDSIGAPTGRDRVSRFHYAWSGKC